MKRFIKVDIGGIPYVNTDFTEVFQRENLVSYRGMLDALNMDSFSGRNSGIILKGCKILTASSGGFVMDFTDSLIYLNGDFLQYNPTSNVNPTILSTTFYLYQSASQSIDRYTRDFSTLVNVAEVSYFDYSTTIPPTGEVIRFSNRGTSRYYKRILKFATSDYGDIYITSNTQSFSATGLGFNDMEGFALLNHEDPSSLIDLSGQFLRGTSRKNVGTSESPQYETDDLVAPNWTETNIPSYQRFRIDTTSLTNLFAKNFQTTVMTQPGVTSVSLRLNDLPKHPHISLGTTYSMTHSHGLDTTFNHQVYLDTTGEKFGGSLGNANEELVFYLDSWAFINGQEINGGNLVVTASSAYGSGFSFSTDYIYFGYNLSYNSFMRSSNQPSNSREHYIYTHAVNSHYASQIYYNSRNQYLSNPSVKRADLYTHTHSFISVNDVGLGNIGDDAAPHDNRPSYRVMAYYTKKYLPPVNIVLI